MMFPLTHDLKQVPKVTLARQSEYQSITFEPCGILHLTYKPWWTVIMWPSIKFEVRAVFHYVTLPFGLLIPDWPSRQSRAYGTSSLPVNFALSAKLCMAACVADADIIFFALWFLSFYLSFYFFLA